MIYDMIRYDTIYSLTAIGLTPGGGSTVHRIRIELQFRPDPCVQWKTPDGGQRNCPKHV